MNNLKQEIEMINYALENGHTNVEVKELANGEVMFIGAFGYITVSAADAETLKALLPKEEVAADNKFVVGAALTKGNRTKTIVEIGYVQYDQPGVLYKVKDGTTRFENMETFKKWMEKAERTN